MEWEEWVFLEKRKTWETRETREFLETREKRVYLIYLLLITHYLLLNQSLLLIT